MYGYFDNSLPRRYEWGYNNHDKIYAKPATYSYSDKTIDLLPFAFYSPQVKTNSLLDLLYKAPAGNVNKSVVQKWIYEYSNGLNHGNIDCNGRQISNDLFVIISTEIVKDNFHADITKRKSVLMIRLILKVITVIIIGCKNLSLSAGKADLSKQAKDMTPYCLFIC